MKHPARFSDTVLEAIREACVCIMPFGARVLDPFAGTGRVHALPWDTYGVELEPEWATMHERTIVGNALELPFPDGTFDAVITSPCYGNRMADHHNASDPSRRRSYTHDLGRTLHRDNAGAMQWGSEYRRMHERAWEECTRVCHPSVALFVLNASDHIRGGVRIPVVGYHLEVLQRLGWALIDVVAVPTPRNRYGENREARVAAEIVALLCR